MGSVQPKQVQREPLPSTCKDYNRREGCSRSYCQELHLCSDFLRGKCDDDSCTKAHTLETARSLQLLSERSWSGSEDLSQAMNQLQQWAATRAVSVCFMYNMGSCTASDCGRLHVCYRHALDACTLDDCGLSHDLLDSAHNVSLLKSAGLVDTPVSELLSKLREQTRQEGPPQPALCRHVYERQGCQRHCLQLHYCEASARGRCRFGAKCYQRHNLQDAHNQRVLKFFGWTEEHVLQELKASACGNTELEELQTERQEWQRERAEWQQREQEWQQKGEEWQQKWEEWQKREERWQKKGEEWQQQEAKWQQKEAKWKQNERAWKEIDNIRTETQAKAQENLERAMKEAENQLKAEIEHERLKREEERQRHLREMSEKQSRDKELLQCHAKVVIELERSEKTMTAIKQMNAEYQKQIARSVESENECKQKTAHIAKEREKHKKNVEELTKLRELHLFALFDGQLSITN